MSDDFEFEVIDASAVEHSRNYRRRSGLGNGKNFIEAVYLDSEDQHRYYSALQRNYRRRHNVSETPYDHLIDPVLAREEEYAKLFPVTLVELRLIVEEEERKNNARNSK